MPKGTSYIQPAKNTNWETPRDLFDELWTEAGGFDCDPCCTPEQYTARRVLKAGGTIYTPDGGYDSKGYYGPEDGLTGDWHGKVFMNPVYGREMPLWIDKAVAEVRCGNVQFVMGLIPSRTDTRIWQRHILHEARPLGLVAPDYVKLVRFLKGRLRFEGAEASAPFPSAVIVWQLPDVTTV